MFSIKSIKKHILGFSNSEKGFTLIEIIAVLVILGILAAVAIPRFTNLQQDAREKSAQSAISEVKSRASQAYASTLLTENGSLANTTGVAIIANMNTLYGDYEVSTTASGNDITIGVTTVQNVAVTANNTDTWWSPGP